MVGRNIQLLSRENLSPSANNFGVVYKSQQIQHYGEAGWILIVRNGAAITGTSPGIIWEVDVSDNGGAFTRVGGAISTFSAAGIQATPYVTGSTQGAMAANTAGHTYVMQVVGTLGNADNVATDISVDLVASV